MVIVGTTVNPQRQEEEVLVETVMLLIKVMTEVEVSKTRGRSWRGEEGHQEREARMWNHPGVEGGAVASTTPRRITTTTQVLDHGAKIPTTTILVVQDTRETVSEVRRGDFTTPLWVVVLGGR